MSDLTTLTAELATMKQKMVQRLTDQGVSGVTVATPMQDIVDDFATLRALNYDTTEITENGTYVAPNGKTGFNNFVVNVPAGGPATHKKYKLLDRVYEDVNGDAIGTVVGFHVDTNNVEYAIVALDAAYRLASGQYMSNNSAVTGMTNYSNAGAYGARETATDNCDKILAQCTTSGYTSSAVSHCRAQSFTIAGDTYAGQLPTLMELLKILEFREAVNTADTTAAANPTLVIPNNQNMWASTQYSSSNAWFVSNSGLANATNRTSNYFVAPVLEIPNA
ncbi:MAG: hypothetical protein IJU89_02455 [Alphaproteobacteria bacterium]|nr:hypothetical protein [Alphaproteobacteria bacterium]